MVWSKFIGYLILGLIVSTVLLSVGTFYRQVLGEWFGLWGVATLMIFGLFITYGAYKETETVSSRVDGDET